MTSQAPSWSQIDITNRNFPIDLAENLCRWSWGQHWSCRCLKRRFFHIKKNRGKFVNWLISQLITSPNHKQQLLYQPTIFVWELKNLDLDTPKEFSTFFLLSKSSNLQRKKERNAKKGSSPKLHPKPPFLQKTKHKKRRSFYLPIWIKASRSINPHSNRAWRPRHP